MSRSLNLDALGAQIGNHLVHPALLDGAQAASRDPQAQEAPFAFRPEAVSMQIRQETAALAIIRVGHRVTGFRGFARDLADSRHGKPSHGISRTAALYTRTPSAGQHILNL